MPKKILVVEDTPDVRDLIHLYFKTDGFDVVVASDGREGLYMARAEKPDLILTDLHMPNIDGIALIKELRAEPAFKDIPIIFLTAFGREDRDNAIRAGADRAVEKPAHFDSLIDDINELLDERKNK